MRDIANNDLDIIITDKTKINIVSYNSSGLFKTRGEKLKNDAEKIDYFDKKWNNRLKALLINSLHGDGISNHRLAQHKLTEKSWYGALQYVTPDKTYCEFSFDGLLCIAQLEKQDEFSFKLQNLWGLRYSNLPREIICVDLETEDNRDKLESVAQIVGEKASTLAKKAILDKVNSIISNLEAQNKSLQMELENLKEQRRKVNISFYQRVIDEFKERLEVDYSETSGSDSWQKWIYRNNWLFGVQYAKPLEQVRIGSDSIIDFLFPTLDGFIDILEIKLPKHKVIQEDTSHTGSFMWSSETNRAIGQVVNYLHKIDFYQSALYLELNQKYISELNTQVSFIKPRAFIVIGRSENWIDPKKQGLRKLNHALHGIEVLTYDDLIRRGQSLIDLYVKEVQ